MREAATEKTRQALEKLAVRVVAGRLKKAQNIGAAAGRILSRNHGSRYYDWRFEQGAFRYFENPVTAGNHKARQILAALGISDDISSCVRIQAERPRKRSGQTYKFHKTYEYTY